jgi:hypothetical protein
MSKTFAERTQRTDAMYRRITARQVAPFADSAVATVIGDIVGRRARRVHSYVLDPVELSQSARSCVRAQVGLH